MTAPAQIASSGSVPVAAPREARGPRSQSDRASNTTGVDKTDETSSSEDSSQATAPDDDVPSGHSNFAAILRQQLRSLSGKSGSGLPSAEGARAQTGQQKDAKLDPAVPATVPVAPTEPHRVIAPLAFAMPTFKTEPDPNETSTTEPSQTEEATSYNDTARTGSSHGSTSASTSPSGQAGANQPSAPDALAFAARLTPPGATPAQTPGLAAQTSADPATTDDAAADTTGTSFGRQLAALKQALSSDPGSPSGQGSGEKSGSGAGEQLLMPNSAPLPPQHMNQGAGQSPAATAASSDPRPALAAPPQRTEQVSEPPATQLSSGHDITVRIPDATDRGTNVRFVERGSEVHVAVRTGDSELAQMLRGGLSDLSGRLSHNGIQAEVWRPSQDSSQSDSQNQSPDSRDSGGRRNQSGAQGDGQDQPSENKPRWVEELEASIAAPPARSGLLGD